MAVVPFIGYARDQSGAGLPDATIQAFAITNLAANTKGVEPLETATPDSVTGRWVMYVDTDESPTGYVSVLVEIGNVVRWIEGDATMQAQRFFAEHGEAPILDDSITDVHLGSRTVNQATAPTGNTGTLTNLLSVMANRIRAITGTTNWYDAPAATLATLWAKFASTSGGGGHTHSGAAGQGPQITTAGIANDAVTGAKIDSDTINSEHYVNGSIDEIHLSGSVQTKLNASSGGGGGSDAPWPLTTGVNLTSSNHSVSTSMSGNLVSYGSVPAGKYLLIYGAEALTDLASSVIELHLYNGSSTISFTRAAGQTENGVAGNIIPMSKAYVVTTSSATTFGVRARTTSGSGVVRAPWLTALRVG